MLVCDGSRWLTAEIPALSLCPDLPPQVRRAGEVVIAAGVGTVVVLGLVALAGAIFGGGRKENKDTQ